MLLQISGSVPPEQVQKQFAELRELLTNLSGVLDFVGGEGAGLSGFSQGFTHAFTIDFVDKDAFELFLSEIDRGGLAARMAQITVGGIGGVLAMDVYVD